ncbi:MAG: fibronectin-binding domain-containing protein [Asgard group archaeon]|nr:fibronectin-binding domain-containing protein [Asgard group archaeon]
MKTSLSSLDIAALVAEIRPKTINSWVNNIYSIGDNLVLLRFRKSAEAPFEIIFDLGKRFHITKFLRKKPVTPNNKILSLRKHIRDLPVNKFYQRKMDRVIVFEIAYKDGFYKLVFELFGEGNIILVGPNNKIILAYRYRRMKDRDVHPGRLFKFPPSSDDNILTLDEETFFKTLTTSQGKITPVLNNILGLGPLYSKDIVSKANITTTKIEDLSQEEIKHLFEKIQELQQVIKNQEYEFVQYLDEDEIVDITPVPVTKYNDLEVQEVESFNESLDEFFSSQEEEPEYTEDKSEVTGKITKSQKTLDSQESHLINLIKQEEDEKRKGDLLYANFALVDELLTTIVNARQADIPWSEIEEKLTEGKKKGIPSAGILEKLEAKNKQIWIKLRDETKNIEEVIELDFTLSVADSANSFYEKSKKARRKIPGAKAAIERSKKQIKDIEDKKDVIVKEVETKPLAIKRSKKWYEKFHWFICGDHIIIGGTDLKTNERILKTYLDDDDLFFHADVHGAPFVVVKDGQDNISEECLAEVAAFALNYSSLWKDKKLVGDVYYVLPDQVSLTPPSGQYLPKGSVMIYGEKNYLKSIEINHTIGILFLEQNAQVIGGPAASVENRTDIFMQIKPGETPKGKIAKELLNIFFKRSSDEQKYKIENLTVNDILPFIPGDSVIIQ